MTRYKDNLKARYIKLTEDELYMVQKVAERKLMELEVYPILSIKVRDIIKSNVLIVATTDNIKRSKTKTDVIIGNLPDAIKLVMDDIKESSAELLEG